MAQPFIADFPPTLGFEASAGQHYMIINSYESKNAVASVNSKTTGVSTEPHLSSIGLYIPAGSLTTSFTGNYEGKEGAALAANAVNAFTGDQGFFAKLGDVFTAAGQKAFSGAALKADQATGFFSAQGKTPNNHMALVYRGPNTFRQHTFAFKFFPKNAPESETVRNIVEELRFGTLPRMSGGAAGANSISDPFFKSPRHHTINFFKGGSGASQGKKGPQNTNLFTIGKSVITNLVLNYDPQSVVSFHDDGNPVQIDMTITFQEIELQINTKDSAGSGFDALARETEVNQNQSSSQTTSEQQAAAQRDANLASLGGQNSTPGLGLGGGNDSFR
jgi:hypothetical protein